MLTVEILQLPSLRSPVWLNAQSPSTIRSKRVVEVRAIIHDSGAHRQCTDTARSCVSETVSVNQVTNYCSRLLSYNIESFRLCSCGLWSCLNLLVAIAISEVPTACISYPEDGGSRFLRNRCNTFDITQSYNPADHNLISHRSENRILSEVYHHADID